MRPSFVHLAVRSVLVFWAFFFASIALYTSTVTWNAERARSEGLFLVHQLLEEVPADERANRLQTIEPNVDIPVALVSHADVEARFGRTLSPGEHVHLTPEWRKEWRLIALEDGTSVLAAGPINPLHVPAGMFPIGVLLMVFLLPLLAIILSVRVEREVTKVERASNALAVGELGARVHNDRGPSNELATSFNEMAERIESLIRSRDELVQAVSHELGSPLARLRFHVALLEADVDDLDRIRAMSRELDELDELVAELLGYVQSDDVELDRRVFSPSPALEDLAELARLDSPRAAEIEIGVELVELELDADPRLFQRAVENLLRNAMRHATGHVELVMAEDADHVVVHVHDDGPGIPEELRDEVRAPFVRLHADRSRSTGGVGLGLAIVSRIMDRHGGDLEIGDSHLGGACVTLRWPGRVARKA